MLRTFSVDKCVIKLFKAVAKPVGIGSSTDWLKNKHKYIIHIKNNELRC